MKSVLIRVPRKFWEGGRERGERTQSWTKGWIGGWCGWRFSRGDGGEEARFESPNSCRTREFQEPGRSWRASLTRACLRDESLWCRKPTRQPADGVSRRASLKWGPFPSPPSSHWRSVYCCLAGLDRPLSRPIREFMAARTKLDKPHALCSIVRHRSRKKRLDFISRTVSSRSGRRFIWK